MITISELADILNRKEGMVILMMRNRDYLKKNGDPKKWCVDAGYMRADGMITKKGERILIEDLGIKESHEDEYDDDEDDEEEDFSDEYDDDESEESEDDDDGGEEEDDDESDESENEDYEKLKELLNDEPWRCTAASSNRPFRKDEIYSADEILSWYQKNPDNEISHNEMDGLSFSMGDWEFIPQSFWQDCVDLREILAERGHTETFIEKVFEKNIALDYIPTLIMPGSFGELESAVYRELSEEETLEDLESVLNANGCSERAIEFIKKETDGYFDLLDSVIASTKVFDEAYEKGLEHYGDEERARRFAESCYYGYYRGNKSVPEFDEEFEDFLDDYGPLWRCWNYGGFGVEDFRNEELCDTERILYWYYEHPEEKISYSDEMDSFSMGGWEFVSENCLDRMNAEPDIPEEPVYPGNDDEWKPGFKVFRTISNGEESCKTYRDGNGDVYTEEEKLIGNVNDDDFEGKFEMYKEGWLEVHLTKKDWEEWNPDGDYV